MIIFDFIKLNTFHIFAHTNGWWVGRIAIASNTYCQNWVFIVIQMNLSSAIASHLKGGFAAINYVAIGSSRKTFRILSKVVDVMSCNPAEILKLVYYRSVSFHRFCHLWTWQRRRRFLVKKPQTRHHWNNFPSVYRLLHCGISPTNKCNWMV